MILKEVECHANKIDRGTQTFSGKKTKQKNGYRERNDSKLGENKSKMLLSYSIYIYNCRNVLKSVWNQWRPLEAIDFEKKAYETKGASAITKNLVLHDRPYNDFTWTMKNVPFRAKS